MPMRSNGSENRMKSARPPAARGHSPAPSGHSPEKFIPHPDAGRESRSVGSSDTPRRYPPYVLTRHPQGQADSIIGLNRHQVLTVNDQPTERKPVEADSWN